MAKKKTKRGKEGAGAPAVPAGKPVTAAARPSARLKQEPVPRWMLPLLLLVTFLVYLPALRAGFVNWDDMDYVYDNTMIRDLSRLDQFFTQPVQGNYHPLTMLSLAINYALSGLEPWSYHLFNVIFHLVNTWLVFRLALLLGNRQPLIAFITAGLFALHPMHVESVAWVSERKDVLYALFFLAGLITYTRFTDNGGKKYYAWSLLFCILSLLSKPAAVVFPLALFTIDILRKRGLTMRVVAEKIPFFLLALAMGILTYLAQKEKGATDLEFPLVTKMLFGFYGIMTYIFKLFFPFQLAAFYPYPATNISLPPAYYAAPLFFIGLVLLVVFSWKRTRVIAFGILFYLVNLLLVLQFLPVGSAIIAERYTYLPYIGLFFILGWLASRYMARQRTTVYAGSFVVLAFLALLSWRQAGVWKDGATLWDHAIETQPSANAYGLRASLLRAENRQEEALVYYNRAVQLSTSNFEVYTNRGNVYFDLKKLDSAYADYRRALALKPNHYPALDNLGALFATKGQYDSALRVLNKCIEIAPGYMPAYGNRALVYLNLKQFDKAIGDYEQYIRFKPDNPDILNTMGFCYRSIGKRAEALQWINKALAMKDSPYYYLNRSYIYFEMNNVAQAKADAARARQAGLVLDPNYERQLGL